MSENKKTKKRGRPKKSVEKMSQTHGMVEGEKYEPTTLDQIWGDDGLAKYQTMDAREYESKVDEMLLADLKTEAIRVGLLPVDNSVMLKARLIREFNVHLSSFRKPTGSPVPPKEIDPKIEDILKEGR